MILQVSGCGIWPMGAAGPQQSAATMHFIWLSLLPLDSNRLMMALAVLSGLGGMPVVWVLTSCVSMLATSGMILVSMSLCASTPWMAPFLMCMIPPSML